MAKAQRPFNPDVLTPFAVDEMRPQFGPSGITVRRYTVLVPILQVQADGTPRPIASDDDRVNLEGILAQHFGGITVPVSVPVFKGMGARDPQRPELTQETNVHTYFLVYAANHDASDSYFRTLKKELEEALDEGVILIERQDVIIL